MRPVGRWARLPQPPRDGSATKPAGQHQSGAPANTAAAAVTESSSGAGTHLGCPPPCPTRACVTARGSAQSLRFSRATCHPAECCSAGRREATRTGCSEQGLWSGATGGLADECGNTHGACQHQCCLRHPTSLLLLLLLTWAISGPGAAAGTGGHGRTPCHAQQRWQLRQTDGAAEGGTCMLDWGAGDLQGKAVQAASA